ncbi:hypothetical protein ONS95_014835 [Cadophora gregata]|uniref:uncharacterized protein n=1 Tax=Cadophora gregata TaxID=51156 RepID=UPI0026DD38A0|nr:uncharacterized protein ONS95_014835 [Cadophora gregata]KAK0113135.1 hypothetical protein ONS95_014835 [Cadophora gregata]
MVSSRACCLSLSHLSIVSCSCRMLVSKAGSSFLNPIHHPPSIVSDCTSLHFTAPVWRSSPWELPGLSKRAGPLDLVALRPILVQGAASVVRQVRCWTCLQSLFVHDAFGEKVRLQSQVTSGAPLAEGRERHVRLDQEDPKWNLPPHIQPTSQPTSHTPLTEANSLT